MQQTPDLSKIVSIIMQNPALVSQIASLVGSTNTESAQEVKSEVEAQKEEEKTAATVQVQTQIPTHNRARRKELINAMKPYLSESRRGAIDSMASILDILDVMVKKET